MPLPPCHSRRDIATSSEIFFCAHPRVHVDGGLVRAEICAICSYWKEPPPAEFRTNPPSLAPKRRGPCHFLGEQIGTRECGTCRGTVRLKVYACSHPGHEDTTLQFCATCPDYRARPETNDDVLPQQAGRVRSWAVGVTTASRERPTLERCLTSLAAAGWDSPRLFAEPGVDVPPQFGHLPVSRRDSPLGAWPNWFLGLSELILRHPAADAYLMVQDDTVFCRNLQPFLEQTLWPSGRVGVVSLFCPQKYVRRQQGLYVVQPLGDLWGALAYVFPNPAARALLSDPAVVDHRRTGPGDGLKNIDTVVGGWAEASGLLVYYHSPSLAQHIGATSTLWNDAINWGHRRSADFVGEDFDAVTLVPAE